MSARGSTASRLAARLGLLAVLFQAVLFGWHHHDLAFAGRQSLPVVANPTAPPQAVDDEDGCEICQTLHHQMAGAVDFAGAPPPTVTPVGYLVAEPAFAPRTRARIFSARAPPLA